VNWEATLLLYGVILGAFLTLGVNIGAAMGLVGIIGLTILSGSQVWNSLADIVFNTLTNFTLVSVPLFVLMGEIILKTGLSRRFYEGVSALLSRVPGALAHSNIFGCAIFSALCGSSVATALTVGTVALPEMRRRGYDDRLTIGTLAGGGCLGILIPPSIPMVIYGSMTNESVLDLFVAGVVPGVILTALFVIYVAAWVTFNPSRVPRERAIVGLKDFAYSVLICTPVLGLVLLIFFSMYYGFATPTEAAALGCALALAIGLGYGELTAKAAWEALGQTVITTSIVLFITINAQFLSFAVVQAGIGRGIAHAMVDSGVVPFVFFCLLFLFYLVLGMFLDGLSLMLLTVPIIYPAMTQMGFNGVWLGILIVIFIELGALTPPMGLNLFAIQSISGGSSLKDIAVSSAPYAAIISAFSFVLYAFPQIALFLPQLMRAN
jgi:tripartite ATP-independent transporter DctM subunit